MICSWYDSHLCSVLVSQGVFNVQEESTVGPFPENFTDTFEYSYPNVTELLGTYGVRSLEFDCFYDPEGGTPLPELKLH